MTLSSSSSSTSILAYSKVFPQSTESIGSTSLSNKKSSLSSTNVLASLPLLIGIECGVGYKTVRINFILLVSQ